MAKSNVTKECCLVCRRWSSYHRCGEGYYMKHRVSTKKNDCCPSCIPNVKVTYAAEAMPVTIFPQ